MPRRRSHDTACPAAKTPAPPHSLRILVVDDQHDTARLLAQLLRSRGHEVHVAHDVHSAKEVAKGHALDLVISDLGLPDGDGVDLMKDLTRRQKIPGIALTGYGMEADRARTRNAGFAEHLVKPVDFDQLQAAIARITMVGRRVAEPWL